jgi:hypothetical protein
MLLQGKGEAHETSQSPVVAEQFKLHASLLRKDQEDLEADLIVDTGVMTNVIGQRYALSLGLEKVDVPTPDSLRYPGNHQGRVYAAYKLRWRAQDHWGVTREQETIFYGTDEPDYSINLGMPGARDAGLLLNLREGHWRYEFNTEDFTLEGGKRLP